MKSYFAYVFMIACSMIINSCYKHDAVEPNNTMTAQVDSLQFNSKGIDVAVAFPLNPSDSTKTELVISGAAGNPSNLALLIIQILNYDKNHATGNYDFDSSEAIGLYSPGSGIEDFFANGSVVITASGSTITGTFSGTTESGVKVTDGRFSVKP